MSTLVENCLITGNEVENIITDYDGIFYKVKVNESLLKLKFDWNAESWFQEKNGEEVFNSIEKERLSELIRSGCWDNYSVVKVTIELLEKLLHKN